MCTVISGRSTSTRPQGCLVNQDSKKCTVRSTRSACRSLITETQLALSLVVYNDGSRRPDPSAFSKLELWHSDVSYELQPPSTTALKIITGPPYGGDTLWASGYVHRNETHPVPKLYSWRCLADTLCTRPSARSSRSTWKACMLSTALWRRRTVRARQATRSVGSQSNPSTP